MNAREFENIARVARDHWWYRATHAMVLDALAPAERGTMLDIGAGAGVTVSVVREARPGWDVVGVEPDPVGRDVAARAGVALEAGSYEHFGPYEGARFDAIVALDNLYYLGTDDAVEHAARRIASHLAPNGVFIGQVAAFTSLRGRHDAWVACERRFRGPELARLFARAGLEVTFRYRYQLLAPFVFVSRRIVEPLVDDAPASDVALPPLAVNELLFALTRAEDLVARGPLGRVYGSSLFWVARQRT